MRRGLLVAALLSLGWLAGCSGGNSRPGASPSAEPGSVADAGSRETRTLAYEHTVQVEAAEGRVAAVFDALQAACQQAAADSCKVLESQVGSGQYASASLKLRAGPAAIPRLIEGLAQQGRIVNRASRAEDLGGPLRDSAKKVALLNDYRARLEMLGERARNDVDSLIKVHKELAQVQSDLEELTGKRAQLIERVETEVLRVSIHSAYAPSAWRPIGSALSDFGANLSQGTGVAITGLAYLLPWLLVLLVAVAGGRRLWRFWRRPRKAG